MKTIFSIFLTIALSLSGFSQEIRQEINTQVWKPFIQAYNNFDTEKFMSVYSRNVIRVPVDQKMIFDYTEYKKNINNTKCQQIALWSIFLLLASTQILCSYMAVS